ncbi:MAG: ROK family protein [Arenicella sp.]
MSRIESRNLQKNKRYFIGVDLGGTKIEIVALDEPGNELIKQRVDTPTSYLALIERVAELVVWVETQLGKSPYAIGVGMPGSQSPETGLWQNCNREYCNDRNVEADLAEILQREVIVENDANCFAMSEALDGAARDYRVVFAITVGTGIGGALVFDQQLHHGPNRIGGEAGHTPLPWMQTDDYPLLECHCGRLGCAEQYISGTGFENDYFRLSGKRRKGKEILVLRDQQDLHAVAAYTRLIDRFARFLAMIYSIVDPDVVVLGGGLSNIDGFIEDVSRQTPKYMISKANAVNLVRASFGDSSGVRGAAKLANKMI